MNAGKPNPKGDAVADASGLAADRDGPIPPDRGGGAIPTGPIPGMFPDGDIIGADMGDLFPPTGLDICPIGPIAIGLIVGAGFIVGGACIGRNICGSRIGRIVGIVDASHDSNSFSFNYHFAHYSARIEQSASILEAGTG